MSDKKPKSVSRTADSTTGDAIGAARLAVTAVEAITDIAEGLHRQISGLALPVGAGRAGRTSGITGMVYASVRGITRLVGGGLNVSFKAVEPLLSKLSPIPEREAVVAALNGVFGDHLEATANPLQIHMQLRQSGQALELEPAALQAALAAKHGDSDGQPNGKLLVLVHGLCMNDLQWSRVDPATGQMHDHGEALAQDLGYTPLYLRYNTGRTVAANGRELSELLEQLLAAWPVPVTELSLLVHSMGGLVTRSACFYGTQAGLAWPKKLKKWVCLGTPHHGAPLERAGSWVDYLLAISPYSAPFARIGLVRSAGIQDLRHGQLVDPIVDGVSARTHMLPLPKGVRLYVVAASKQGGPLPSGRQVGDGLVTVKSALGQHATAALCLPIPATRQHVVYGLDHFNLLSSSEVYGVVKRWLT